MKWLRKVFGGISLTAAMFVFQACYGTGEYYYDDDDSRVTFHVTEEETGKPLSKIRIEARMITVESGSEGSQDIRSSDKTDTNGMVTMWATKDIAHHFYIIDDSSRYATADTILFPIEVDTVNISLKLKTAN